MEADSYRSLLDEIQRLQADRRSHVDALRSIDEILAAITQRLGMRGALHQSAREIPQPLDAADQLPLRPQSPARQRKYMKLPQTGEEFVLAFIRDHGGPTTLEINHAWRAQGRGGAANNVIGRLLKQGAILREPLGDQRGSRYRVPPSVVADDAAL